jgi:hypothetical protein
VDLDDLRERPTQQVHDQPRAEPVSGPHYLFCPTVTELDLFFVLPSFRWSPWPLGRRVVRCCPAPFMQPKVVSFKHSCVHVSPIAP